MTASVPFMITQDMKRRLRDRGYTNDDIAHLTPQQAHDILARERQEGSTPNDWRVEITLFQKDNGPLTKRITLATDGSVKSDGSACLMARGVAQRRHIGNIGELATVIEGMRSNQAIALGALRADVPDEVNVVTKGRLNGQARTIARTAADINYRKGVPALALIDFDTKGMPKEIAIDMELLGGFWPTLISVLPALRTVAHLVRRSTSAGLFRADTGAKLPGSSGLHVYVQVEDGADIERFSARPLLDRRIWMDDGRSGWANAGALPR